MNVNIDLIALFNFLKEQNNPIVETTLLRKFIADEEIEIDDIICDNTSNENTSNYNLILFRKHFILYHNLYKLKKYLEEQDYLLFIKQIYIYLFKKPSKEYCPYFDEENIRFCMAKKSVEKEYCDYHLEKINKDRLEGNIGFQKIDEYYLDIENLYRMDKTKLEKMMNFTLNYANSKEEIDESLLLLGVNLGDSLELVKKKYRLKAKELHPDLSHTDAREFNKLNNAYNIIINNLYS